ncbi:hypothetical protein DBR06_SOUSAS2810001, partial [Sousa chinensis]
GKATDFHDIYPLGYAKKIKSKHRFTRHGL